MTDIAKPPMVLYFRENISTVFMDGSHMDNRFGHAFANKNRELDVGPYVHLDQFMAEVDKLGKQMFNSSFHHGTRAEMEVLALQKLVKEIKEQQ